MGAEVLKMRLEVGAWLPGNQAEDLPHSPKGPWEAEEGLEEGVNVSRDQICWRPPPEYNVEDRFPPPGVCPK